MSSLKEKQISVRVPEEVDRWLEERAGGARKKAAFIRGLVERERAVEREGELLRMFNRAAEDLTEEDREERERLVSALAHHD